jgi:YD repeat-containing protein
MRIALLTFLGFTLLFAPQASARGHDLCRLQASCCERPVRWAQRYDDRGARIAITSRDGDATLLLTEDVVALQLSDRTLHRIKRELRQDRDDDEDNPLAQAIKSAVVASVSSLLDHCAECPISDLRDVDYRDGRLVFITESGKEIFQSVQVDDADALRGFTAGDARQFVKEFRRLKGRQS